VLEAITAVLLLGAAAGGAAAAVLGRALPLPQGEETLDPSHHWPDPLATAPVTPERGPVVVLVEYRVLPARHAAFRRAIAPLGEIRRRDGATAWGVTVDTEDASRLVERFLLVSWGEHLRQHGRVTVADPAVQEAVNALHEGPEPPRVRHLIGLSWAG